MPLQVHPDWTVPNPDALLDPEGPPVPDDESLLSEVATYPAVAYPAMQEDDGEEKLEETIYAGLVFP